MQKRLNERSKYRLRHFCHRSFWWCPRVWADPPFLSMSLGFLFWSALCHRVTRAISQQSLASHVIPQYRSPTLFPHKNFHGFSSGFTVWIFLINRRQRLHYAHEQNGPNFYEWPGFWPSFAFGRRMCLNGFSVLTEM